MTDMAPAEITPGGDGVRSGQAGIAELLWGMRERPARGPKPAFSIGHIARVAVDIADTDGVQAVSMQRVASELQFTKMAMYRYVSGKAELLAVMIEEAVGEPPDLRSVAGGWRPRLEEWARCMWAAWDRHPWLPAARPHPQLPVSGRGGHPAMDHRQAAGGAAGPRGPLPRGHRSPRRRSRAASP